MLLFHCLFVAMSLKHDQGQEVCVVRPIYTKSAGDAEVKRGCSDLYMMHLEHGEELVKAGTQHRDG